MDDKKVRTKISLSSLVEDAYKFCQNGAEDIVTGKPIAIRGLLIVSGSSEQADAKKLKNEFIKKTSSSYPVAIIDSEEYQQIGKKPLIDGGRYYLVELNQIEITDY